MLGTRNGLAIRANTDAALTNEVIHGELLAYTLELAKYHEHDLTVLMIIIRASYLFNFSVNEKLLYVRELCRK